jgi:hypothetical protein
MTAVLGLLAKEGAGKSVPYVGSPAFLFAGVLLMFIAGVCGAIVASSCTECPSYEQLWEGEHGPFGTRLLKGRTWARLEHAFFWLSVVCMAWAVLSAQNVRTWVFH